MTLDERTAEEVRALTRLDLQELRSEWRRRFGEPPRLRSADLLRYMMGWRIQVATLGDHETQMKRELRRPETSGRTALSLSPGTRLSREWRGRVYEVDVAERGFIWRGETFSSLSAIATAITGVKWNGRRFFGLDRQ